MDYNGFDNPKGGLLQHKLQQVQARFKPSKAVHVRRRLTFYSKRKDGSLESIKAFLFKKSPNFIFN